MTSEDATFRRLREKRDKWQNEAEQGYEITGQLREENERLRGEIDCDGKARCTDMITSVCRKHLMDGYVQLNQECEQERSRAEQAEARVLEVVRGEFTQICSYCGFEAPPPNGWEELEAHIKVCEKHPLRKAEVALAEVRGALAEIRKEADRQHPTMNHAVCGFNRIEEIARKAARRNALAASGGGSVTPCPHVHQAGCIYNSTGSNMGCDCGLDQYVGEEAWRRKRKPTPTDAEEE